MQRAHQIAVTTGNQTVSQFDYAHCALTLAQRVVDGGHFQADDTAADHQQAFWHVFERQRTGRVEQTRIIVGKTRDFGRLGTHRDDGVVKANLGVAGGAGHFHGVGGLKLRRALNHGDFALFG